jgi:hypothetical protein
MVINNRKELFRKRQRAKIVLFRVLREADKIFTFEMRELSLGAVWLSFYIKPKDGFSLRTGFSYPRLCSGL